MQILDCGTGVIHMISFSCIPLFAASPRTVCRMCCYLISKPFIEFVCCVDSWCIVNDVSTAWCKHVRGAICCCTWKPVERRVFVQPLLTVVYCKPYTSRAVREDTKRTCATWACIFFHTYVHLRICVVNKLLPKGACSTFEKVCLLCVFVYLRTHYARSMHFAVWPTPTPPFSIKAQKKRCGSALIMFLWRSFWSEWTSVECVYVTQTSFNCGQPEPIHIHCWAFILFARTSFSICQ